MHKRNGDTFWQFIQQFKFLSILLVVIAAAGVIMAFIGTYVYVYDHSINMTECLPIKYDAKIGLCRYCKNKLDCSPIYPVRGYVSFLFLLNGKNSTISLTDLFCGNSINGTIENGKKTYPPNEWVKCGYSKSNYYIFGDQYPSDHLWIMTVGYSIIGVCIIIFTVACCTSYKVRNEETEPLV